MHFKISCIISNSSFWCFQVCCHNHLTTRKIMMLVPLPPTLSRIFTHAPCYYYVIITTLQSVLRQDHRFFRIEFSTQYHLLLSLSVSTSLSFPQGHPVAAHVFFLVFSSLLSFPSSFLQKRVSEGSSYARCDQSI